KFEFTNVKCTSLDTKFTEFEYCLIKSINRTYKYVSLKTILFQKPVTKVKLNFALYKRFNGYKPFLYNITIDCCRFLNNTSAHPIANFFYGFMKDYSNMNHTCPFNHDLIMEKISVGHLNHQVTKVLPFPNGDYMLDTYWMAYDITRARLAVYATIS
ncbi:hypothetical protein KR009_003723, partial [Drosophila setifemur]